MQKSYISQNEKFDVHNSPEEAEAEKFYEDLQDLLELTPKKNVLYRGLECKSSKSRDA